MQTIARMVIITLAIRTFTPICGLFANKTLNETNKSYNSYAIEPPTQNDDPRTKGIRRIVVVVVVERGANAASVEAAVTRQGRPQSG